MNMTEFYHDVLTVASPGFRDAWHLQEDIEIKRKELKEMEESLKVMMESLAGIGDEIFAVANLRPYRIVDKVWVKKHMPKVYEKTIKVSDTNAGRILHSMCSREETNRILKEKNPLLFDSCATISITDFEKELGKSKAKEYEGIAFKTEMRAQSKTQIVVKHPEKYNVLPASTEDEGGDEE